MYCPNCGARQQSEDVNFCSSCATQLTQVKTLVYQWEVYLKQTENNSSMTENRKSVDKKINLKIFIPAVIIYTFVIGFVLFFIAGADISFSTDPIDSFKDNLKASGYVEKEDNVYEAVRDGYTYGFDFNKESFYLSQDYERVELFYNKALVNFSIEMSFYELNSNYYLDKGVFECSVKPDTYRNKCTEVKQEVIDLAIELDKSFDDLLKQMKMTRKDLGGKE